MGSQPECQGRVRFAAPPKARLQVAGLTRAVMTYEPLARLDVATALQKRTAALHRHMVDRFVASDFSACLESAEQAERECGAHKLTTLYRELSERRARQPPGPEFAGKILLREK
jgi:hypothetical protein